MSPRDDLTKSTCRTVVVVVLPKCFTEMIWHGRGPTRMISDPKIRTRRLLVSIDDTAASRPLRAAIRGSAVTVFSGRKRMIVYNDRRPTGRQNSNVTHEGAHGLLLHEPKPAVDHRGCRLWDQDVEDEANWLAGVLLVPEDAALAVGRGWMSEEAAALHFGVNEQMLNYRHHRRTTPFVVLDAKAVS